MVRAMVIAAIAAIAVAMLCLVIYVMKVHQTGAPIATIGISKCGEYVGAILVAPDGALAYFPQDAMPVADVAKISQSLPLHHSQMVDFCPLVRT